MKYDLPGDEGEVLPNLLGLTTFEEVGLAEFEGFVRAEILLTETLTVRTRFTSAYVLQIHRFALEHLYGFAGRLREVNVSKGGFPFPAARFLPQAMQTFEQELLRKLPNRYSNPEALIRDIAVVHAELLFIHPFREGNGRTARILANLMVRKAGYDGLQFERIDERVFEEYIAAVHQAASQKYEAMEGIIRLIFPA